MKYGTVSPIEKPISRLVMGVIPLPHHDLGLAFALLDAYRELGGNIIDNSYSYGSGFANVMKAYYEARGEDALLRFDKGNHHVSNDDAGRRVTKEHVDNDLRGNLERQGVSYSDFYVLHRDDPRVPAGQVVEWLNEHKAEGRVKAFGGSNWHHTRIAEANAYAEKHGLQGFSVASPNLSLATANEPMWWEALSISADQEARDYYAKAPVALFSWSSGGGGWFARIDSPDVQRVYNNQVNIARRERLEQLASDKGITPTQLALAWTLNHPGNIFALIGPRTVEQVEDNMKAVDVELTSQEHQFLEHGTI